MSRSITPRPLIIGISGGSASGKSEACRSILDELLKKAVDKKAIVLSMSSFYRQFSEEEISLAVQGLFDLDHPRAFDFNALEETLLRIKRRQSVFFKTYDPVTFLCTQKLEITSDIDIVIIEGILTFYKKDISDLFHMKIFVEADADTRLSRKVIRDVCERKRPLNVVLENYFNFVKPCFEEFCLPTKKYADVILPRAPDNAVGIELITEHLLQLMSMPSSSGPCSPPIITNHIRLRNQSESVTTSCMRPH